MRQLMISETLSNIPYSDKEYLQSYEEAGFETGVGDGGRYPGHAHMLYTDVVYSPTGLSTRTVGGKNLIGQMLIIPPRTYVEDIQTNKFWFMKFMRDGAEVRLPDKVHLRLSEGLPLMIEPEFRLTCKLYRKPSGPRRKVEFHLREDCLDVYINGTLETRVRG